MYEVREISYIDSFTYCGDDVILLYNGSKRDDSKLREILNLYCTGIGIMVNMKKYSIDFNDVVEEQINSIPHLKLSSMFQILGVLYQEK
jgi:hypothetical protein